MNIYTFNNIGRRRVPLDSLGTFLLDLGIMLRANIPMKDILEMKAAGGIDKWQKKLSKGLLKGNCTEETLVDGLEHSSSIPPALCQFFREQGGDKLPQSLIKGGRLLKQLGEIKEKDGRHLLAYPAITFITALLIFSVQLIFVVPVFEEFFTSFGAGLPGLTQFVVDLSHFFSTNLVFILIGLSFFIMALRLGVKYSHMLQKFTLRLSQFLPIIGRYHLAVETLTFLESVRTCRTDQKITSTGLLLASQLSGASYVKFQLNHFSRKVKEDISHLKTINWTPVYGRQVNLLMEHLLQHNSLDKVAANLVATYRLEARERKRQIQAILEPLLIIFVGTTIGLLVVSMYLPLFKMSSVI